jgi:hypothetical protein
VLGPLLVAQYLFWIRVNGHERTTAAYRQADPHPVAWSSSGTRNVAVRENEVDLPRDA